ncbi:MAG: 50S ribosomal protein L6 [Deltaproteobacteria bacterium]|nr:50S ribosomal protein L6 [Deltaproteobacteria bacterium]
MSRIGKKIISLPKDAKVKIDGASIQVEGPKGKLAHTLPEGISAEMKDDGIHVARVSDGRRERSLHGLSRTLIDNMVTGVTTGFSRELEIVGVGFRGEKKGKALSLSLGYSHTIEYPEPDGIKLNIEKQIIKVEGIDKCLVGQTASKIRSFRKPDVYKGKGIRYVGEEVRKKVGKTGAK